MHSKQNKKVKSHKSINYHISPGVTALLDTIFHNNQNGSFICKCIYKIFIGLIIVMEKNRIKQGLGEK